MQLAFALNSVSSAYMYYVICVNCRNYTIISISLGNWRDSDSSPTRPVYSWHM